MPNDALQTTVTIKELHEGLSALRLGHAMTERDLDRSLEKLGQLNPILAYLEGKNIEVIDGFKRLRAARKLGWPTLQTLILPVDSQGAKLRLYQTNQTHGMSEIEESWLVRSLYRKNCLTQSSIAMLLGRHKSWVCRRLALAESLCDEVQADLRLGLMGSTMARELARLARGNQSQIAQIVLQRGYTTRQTQKLVDNFLAATDGEEYAKLLDINKCGTIHRIQRKSHGEKLLADTQAIGRIAVRLESGLLARPLLSLGSHTKDLVEQALEELQPTLISLLNIIGKNFNRSQQFSQNKELPCITKISSTK